MSKDKKNEKNLLTIFWPKITNEKEARETAKIGVWGAGIVAGITGAASLYSAYSSPVLGLSLWSLVDALIFAIIAVGIWKMSRVAAVLGLCLYLHGQWHLLTTVGETANGAMIAIFVMFFANGIRGTFTYHRIRSGKRDLVEDEN